MAVKPTPAVDRIRRRLVRDEGTGCHVWTGATSNGYGIIQLGRGIGTARTHVVMWEAVNGPKPPGTDLRHSCDVRACANLDHLSLGTRKENMADAKERNRLCFGERRSTALTDDDIRFIRASRHKIPAAELAARFGVRRGWIYDIQGGRGWKHVA